MKILKYSEVKPTHFESDEVKGVAARVVVGKRVLFVSISYHRSAAVPYQYGSRRGI
jgi:hypothetical protein